MTQVRLGNLSIDPMNVRKTDRGPEPIFVNSITSAGVICDLIVRSNVKKPGHYLVTDGGKRLVSLIEMRDKKLSAKGAVVTDDYMVDVKVVEQSDAEATKVSTIANLIRRDMHPVDEFDAFADMIAGGMTVEEISKEFDRPVADVRQSLALSRIAEPIRKAWRAGDITDTQAEAFTPISDLKLQEQAFAKVRKNKSFDEDSVLRALNIDAHNVTGLLNFVTEDAYTKAGHEVRKTLFEDDWNGERGEQLSDVNALIAMAAEKLAAEIAKLEGQGWGWVVTRDKAPNDWRAWRTIPAGDLTKEQKGQAGCVVHVNQMGKLEVERGIIKPGTKIKVEKKKEKGKTATAPKAGSKGEEPTLSSSQTVELSKQFNTALAHTLQQEKHDLLFDLLIATIWASDAIDGSSPIRIEMAGGLGHDDEFIDRTPNDFEAAYRRVKALNAAQKTKLMASILAAALDVSSGGFDLDDDIQSETALLVDLVNQKNLLTALRDHWDAKAYFNAVPKLLCVAAIKEAMGEDHARRAATLPKTELAKFASTNVPGTGWLPEVMRPESYDGPAEKKKKPITKRKAA